MKNRTIQIIDYSEYEQGMCLNGGHYSFTEEFSYIPAIDRWEVSYSTSAEFEYCPCCGQFGSDHKYCGYEYVTTGYLISRLREVESNQDMCRYSDDPAFEIVLVED